MDESKFYRVIKPLIPPPLRPLALRYQELLSYLFFGAMTTLVNLVLYYPLSRFVSYLVANVISWIGAVTFAFWVNKAFVFEAPSWDTKTLLRQGGAFAAARLFSLGVEELILFIFVEQFHFSPDVIKLIAQVIVILMNYVFSKRVIFRKQ